MASLSTADDLDHTMGSTTGAPNGASGVGSESHWSDADDENDAVWPSLGYLCAPDAGVGWAAAKEHELDDGGGGRIGEDIALCESSLEAAVRLGHLEAARELLLHGVQLRRPLCKEDLEMTTKTEEARCPSRARRWLSPWSWGCSLGCATREIWELASHHDRDDFSDEEQWSFQRRLR